MDLLSAILTNVVWTALATAPALLAAYFFSRMPGASPAMKSRLCRIGLCSGLLVLAAIGVEVQPSLRHSYPAALDLDTANGVVLGIAAVWMTGIGFRLTSLWRTRSTVKAWLTDSIALVPSREATIRSESRADSAVQFRVSDAVPTVAVVYGASPIILIPTRFVDDADIALAVSHELSHVAHRDSAWNLSFELLACAIWFSPLVHFLGRRIMVCQELAADQGALDRCGWSRARYAKMLLRYSEMSAPSSAFAAALGSRCDLEERLNSLRPRRPFAAAVSAFAAGIALLTMIPVRSAEAPSALRHLHSFVRSHHNHE